MKALLLGLLIIAGALGGTARPCQGATCCCSLRGGGICCNEMIYCDGGNVPGCQCVR